MELTNPFMFIISLVVLIYSAILHEIAHGYVADRLGDPTARLLGRLTLNPVPHIDPFLSLAVPLLLILTGSPIIFGGAKPVPVDMFNLRDGRKDMALVALAGPLTNVGLAVIAAVLLKVFYPGASLFTIASSGDFFAMILGTILRLNILLAIFNLLPIPPLDGSKVFSLILPEREANSYLALGSFGMIIIFFLLMVPIGPFSLQDFMATIYTTFLHFLGF
jgi:Zn-dependent protease